MCGCTLNPSWLNLDRNGESGNPGSILGRTLGKTSSRDLRIIKRCGIRLINSIR